MIRVSVQIEDFNPGSELGRLEALGGGAAASFTSIVLAETEDVVAIELEARPDSAQHALQRMAEDAMVRWPLLGVTLIHRYDVLPIGSHLVFAAAASPHRSASLRATAFLIERAQSHAPFRKREWLSDGTCRRIGASLRE